MDKPQRWMLFGLLLGVVGLFWAYIPMADRVGPKDSLIEPEPAEPVEAHEEPMYDPRWDMPRR